MATQPKVLFIVGSLRERSFNKQMAQFTQTLFDDRAQVLYLDWSEFPVFNQDAEFPAPAAVSDARNLVADADALWIFSPEYNKGVPGPLKNAIDWLSRSLEDGSPSPLSGKVATVSGVGGSGCVRHSLAAWMSTFDFLKFQIPPASFTGMSFDREMYTSGVLSLDEATKLSLKKQADKLLEKLS